MGRKSLLPIAYNYLGSVTTIASTKSLPASRVTVSYDFVYDDGKPGSGGTGAIFIDGKKVASSRIEGGGAACGSPWTSPKAPLKTHSRFLPLKRLGVESPLLPFRGQRDYCQINNAKAERSENAIAEWAQQSWERLIPRGTFHDTQSTVRD